jgi:hypothetical protein
VTARRNGTTLVEVVVTLVLGLALLQMAWSTLATARRVEADMRRRSERLSAVRVGRVVVRETMRRGVPGRDWRLHDPDSVVVRAFQGYGLVCPGIGTEGDLLVAWSGRRQPDPSKDSVLVLGDVGDWSAVALDAASGTDQRCPSDDTVVVQAWTLAPPRSEAILLRLFEPASFHVGGREERKVKPWFNRFK